jgi:hypothetical protein
MPICVINHNVDIQVLILELKSIKNLYSKYWKEIALFTLLVLIMSFIHLFGVRSWVQGNTGDTWISCNFCLFEAKGSANILIT